MKEIYPDNIYDEDDVLAGFNHGWWWGFATGAFVVVSLVAMLLGLGLYFDI